MQNTAICKIQTLQHCKICNFAFMASFMIRDWFFFEDLASIHQDETPYRSWLPGSFFSALWNVLVLPISLLLCCHSPALPFEVFQCMYVLLVKVLQAKYMPYSAVKSELEILRETSIFSETIF